MWTIYFVLFFFHAIICIYVNRFQTHTDVLIENASPIVSPAMSPVSLCQQPPPLPRSDIINPAAHDREMRRHRNANRSRSRSRSRSFERGLGGGRDRNVEKIGGNGHHQFRNKSPPGVGSVGGAAADRRSFDRRTDGRRGNNNWKSHSRSPERWPISHRGNSPVDQNGAAKSKRQRCRDFEGEFIFL